ncbi:hypothetical protein PybrP1_008022 [[Pythium] brassicae (nom. inval.)]|nr:hypothetical protein PybrP1_008022 [[Pythium] brassicae (nom. inval.)]
MKRGRDDDCDAPSSSSFAVRQGAFSPVHPSFPTQQLGAASISPWKQPPLFGANAHVRAKPAPLKRFRDRSVPIDAMSRMMSAAVTSARMKKHSAQLQAMSMLPTASSACCAVCESGKRYQNAPPAVDRCSYCEKLVGACCRRDCERCLGAFCSLCSTLKYVVRSCDAQFDRVLCWSCNEHASA